MAIIFGWITCFYTGFGAGAAWIAFTSFGTVILTVIAGRDRCFFTALFTILFVTLLLIGMAYGCFLDDWQLSLHEAVFIVCFFETAVILPTAFAWLVTKLLKKAKDDT